MTSDTKACPFWVETIKATAKKCRFRGEFLTRYIGESMRGKQPGGDNISNANVRNSKRKQHVVPSKKLIDWL